MEAAPSFDTSSAEFAGIIDRKIAKRRRNSRVSFVVTVVLFFGSTIGGSAWFVSDPARVTALKATIADLRTATDVGALRAKYAQALAKIGTRKTQIDDASTMMGVDPTKENNHKDQHFDAEMKELMGEDGGPTTAERNRKFTAKADQWMKAGLIKDTPPAEPAK